MRKSTIILFLSILSVCSYAIQVESLTCNFAHNPVIENPFPSLGWVLSSNLDRDLQTAYEINVASSENLLKNNKPDIWQTGKIDSGKSQHVPYRGRTLENGKKYYWKARVWDKNGNPSKWSDINSWIIALGENDWKAQWIGAIDKERSKLPEGRIYHTPHLEKGLAELWEQVDTMANRSIMLRKEFVIKGVPEEAKIHISGLGHYDLYINGVRIDNSVFKPLWSDYDNTVYYNTFDITSYLKKGTNVIGVILGNGMYNIAGGRYTKFRGSFGPPTLIVRTELGYKNGTTEYIVSNKTWKYDVSPVAFNCIFGGEDYDARLEQGGWSTADFDDSKWKNVVIQEAPKGRLTAQSAPYVAIHDIYEVAKVKETAPGTFIFDMGQNLAGYPTIKVQGKKGQKIRLTPTETANSDTTKLVQGSSGSPYYFEYTLKGDGIEEWMPMFSYYGYQFIEISGINYLKNKNDDLPVLLDIKSNFIHSSAEPNGTFETSNELFNRIHYIIDRATRSNMQAVLTDCPHREKLGWLEETHLNGPGMLFNYDMRTLYPKIMQDIRDAQLETGLVPDIAPEYVIFDGGFRDSPEWGTACIMIPWMYYEWYGDDRLIKEYYPVMKKYVDYLTTKSSGYILSHGLGDWYDHGPDKVGKSQNTPIEITATGHYYMAADYLSKSAKMTGNKNDEQKYTVLAENIKNAYNMTLFDKNIGNYGSGSQCSNSMPLFLGIVPDEYKPDVLKNLLADIELHGGKLTTGDVGNRYLYMALSGNGCDEVMYKMHNHYDIPGYGFQIAFGVTTLTEQWDSRKGMSWNHFMMGQIEEWFFRSLAGINPDIENPGFKHFYIKPSVTGDLTSVSASYNSIYGLIESAWTFVDRKFEINITVPVNTTATYIHPFTKETTVLASGMHKLK